MWNTKHASLCLRAMGADQARFWAEGLGGWALGVFAHAFPNLDPRGPVID